MAKEDRGGVNIEGDGKGVVVVTEAGEVLPLVIMVQLLVVWVMIMLER